jgi:hypothetical protein
MNLERLYKHLTLRVGLFCTFVRLPFVLCAGCGVKDHMQTPPKCMYVRTNNTWASVGAYVKVTED